MQNKKLSSIVKNIENAISKQNHGPNHDSLNKSIIKKAQNLIKNGPKNLTIQNRENSYSSRNPARPANKLKIDAHLNRSLNKSQDTGILSSVTKNSNHNNSPGLSHKSSKILKNDTQITISKKNPKENKFGRLSNLETKKNLTKLNKMSPTPSKSPPSKSQELAFKKPQSKYQKSPQTVPKNKKPTTPTKKGSEKKLSSDSKKKLSVSQDKKIKNYQETLARFEVYNQLKSKNLHDLRLKYRNEELSNTSSKSFLSKNSSKYLKDKEYKPPCKKVNDVIARKKQSICNIREKISKEKAIKNPEPSFRPITSETRKNQRSKDDFYREMMQWMKHKKENQVLMELELKQNESVELTFHPEINYNSNNIVKELDRGQSVEERLNKWKKTVDQKKNFLLKNLTPDFKPKISENTDALAQSHREKIKQKQLENQEQYENDNNDENQENNESFQRNEEIHQSPKKNPSVSFNLDNNTMEEIERNEPEDMHQILQKDDEGPGFHNETN